MKTFIKITILLLTAVLLTACTAHAPEADLTKPNATVSLSYADGLKYAPSFAVWIEDEAGNTATLFATSKVATGLKNRPEALPVWTGIREADAASGATPKDKAALTLNIPDDFAGEPLKIFIEANASYDFNDFYAEGIAEGAEGYSGVNGQPSEIWTANIDTAQPGIASFELTSSGDVLGADHHPNGADSITAPVLTVVSVKWELGQD